MHLIYSTTLDFQHYHFPRKYTRLKFIKFEWKSIFILTEKGYGMGIGHGIGIIIGIVIHFLNLFGEQMCYTTGLQVV